MSRGRVHLGRDQHAGGYRRVFEIEDGLEVDENNLVEIERTRVYFDDVLGITYHRQISWVVVIAMGLVCLIFLGLSVALAIGREGVGAIVTGGIGLPFLVILVLHLYLKIDIVTVFGKRTMARMKFSFRKGRAREIYRDLTRKIQARQAKVAAETAPPPAAPVPLPPPPPLPPPQ